MTRRSRTRGPVCSLGWARRRNGAVKILVIFGHEVFVDLAATVLTARVSYDRERGQLRIVPHPDGETPIGAVNVRAEHCRRDRDKRYSLYVDVPADVGPGVRAPVGRVVVPHTCSAGVLTVGVPATFAVRLPEPVQPSPAPAPTCAPEPAPRTTTPVCAAPSPPAPRRPPPMPMPPRPRVVRPLGPPPHHNPFGDPTPERSALGQGYTPGSGLMRQR